jgi:hypothetical protein
MSKSVRTPVVAAPEVATPSVEGGQHEQCTPELSGTELDDLGDLFDNISLKYGQILVSRLAGVRELNDDANVEDPPPAWQGLALAAATIALSVATAGVGGAVAASIGAGVASGASKAVAKGIDDAIKAAIDTSLNATISGTLSTAMSNPGNSPADAFFRAQAASITEANVAAQDAFTSGGGRDMIRCADDPIQTAQTLLTSLESGRAVAQATQRLESLSSFCTLLAQADLGVNREGTPNAGTELTEQLGDTSAKGVLGLQIETGERSRSRVTVTDAEIEGLNEGLRGDIERTPLNSLRMPITVHGEIDPATLAEQFFTKEPLHRGRLRFGQNESGTKFNDSSRAGDRWLASRGNYTPHSISAPGTVSEGPTEAEEAGFKWEGIRGILEDDLGPMSLKRLGVSLGG